MPRISSKFKSQLHALDILWTRWKRRVLRYTTGGQWTDELPPESRHNLRALWLDGLFANVSEQIIIAYLTLYLLALGGTHVHVGFMNSLSNLGAALVLLPGAILAERWGRRRAIVLLTGGGTARLALMLIPLVPLLFPGPAGAYVLIGLAVARITFAQLGMPAWMSLTSDIVPLSGRGRFFAGRNILAGMLGMAITLSVGQMINAIGDQVGYPLALTIAAITGLIATYWYAQIRDFPHVVERPPARSKAKQRLPWRQLFQNHPEFWIFCSTSALWNLSLQIAAPFFTPFLAEELGARAGAVAIVQVAASLSALPAQRLFGPLVDRLGARRVRIVTGLLIPLLPMCWIFVQAPWHAIPINLIGGFLWAGFNLANFGLLLSVTPEGRRERYSALYQMVVTGSFAVGAALGGLVVDRWGYAVVFVLSGLGRLTAAVLYAWPLIRSLAALIRSNPPKLRIKKL